MLIFSTPGVIAGLGASSFAGLAAGGWAYAALWPGSALFGTALIAPQRPGELALTFDDGPNPAWTPQLLEVLAEHQVRATFFLVGRYAQAEPGLVKRIAEAGHLIGNHSWNHPNMALAGVKRIRSELRWTQKTLEQLTGKPVTYFRPPFGARRPSVFRMAQELGMMPVLWNAMTSDWADMSAEQITERLAERIERNGQRGRASNIVLHDGGHRGLGADRGASVEAAGRLMERLKETHRFVTLEAWG